MTTETPILRVRDGAGKIRELRLYDSSRPQERAATVYMAKTLPDGVRLAFDRDYKLLGSVEATPAEWDSALIDSLDSWAKYSLNDRVPGDAVWFEACGEAREPYRRGWIEGRAWEEEREG